MEWQPIETAPKDGADFLFNAPQVVSGCSIGFYDKHGRLCLTYDGREIGIHVTPPTHWMPLPTPPR